MLKYWQHITGLVVVTDGALCRTDGFSAFGKKGKVLDVPRWERRGGSSRHMGRQGRRHVLHFLVHLEPSNLSLANLPRICEHSTLREGEVTVTDVEEAICAEAMEMQAESRKASSPECTAKYDSEGSGSAAGWEQKHTLLRHRISARAA